MARRGSELPEPPRSAELLPVLIDLIGRKEPLDARLRILAAAHFGYAADEFDVPLVRGTNRRFSARYSAAMGYLLRQKMVVRTKQMPVKLTALGLLYFQGVLQFNVAGLTIDPAERIDPWSPAAERKEAAPPPPPQADAPVEPVRRKPAEETMPRKSDDEVRKERANNAAERAISSLGALHLSRIYTIWVNASRLIAEADDQYIRAASERVIAAIEAERVRRKTDESAASEDESFRWPTTDISATAGGSREQSSSEGALANIGYHVGRTRGEPRSTRQRTLEGVFKGTLSHKAFEKEFTTATWDQPGSGRRLRRMAYTIANLAKNAKRRNPKALAVAIAEWEEDLEWMRETFYEGRFDFGWPSTLIVHVAQQERLYDASVVRPRP